MRMIENAAEFQIARFDGVNASGVYIGSLTHLDYVSHHLKWRVDEECSRMCFDPFEVLTLAEIADQLKDVAIMITVIVSEPFGGAIYQYGNYRDGNWWQVGDLDGYA